MIKNIYLFWSLLSKLTWGAVVALVLAHGPWWANFLCWVYGSGAFAVSWFCWQSIMPVYFLGVHFGFQVDFQISLLFLMSAKVPTSRLCWFRWRCTHPGLEWLGVGIPGIFSSGKSAAWGRRTRGDPERLWRPPISQVGCLFVLKKMPSVFAGVFLVVQIFPVEAGMPSTGFSRLQLAANGADWYLATATGALQHFPAALWTCQPCLPRALVVGLGLSGFDVLCSIFYINNV